MDKEWNRGIKRLREITQLLADEKRGNVICAKFVLHLLAHLHGKQVPICKICGKDIFEIEKE